ncbi:tubulin glycylase 3A-like [Atheta coriaria]|uniref:tubulin glycylase 3A-like n=1 Tax=Dalotia coriaria TaxID=877792 RepID=UPI0031F37B03
MAPVNNWAERSQSVRAKLDEIMNKHSKTLRNLTDIYNPKRTITSPGPTSYENSSDSAGTTKWPSMTTASRLKANVTLVEKLRPSKIVIKRPTSSHTRYNSAAILNVNGATSSYAPTSITANSNMKVFSSTYPLREEIKILREKVEQAIKYKRTFTVSGNYYTIRQALLLRGWVEKYHINYVPPNVEASLYRRLQTLSVPELSLGLKDKDLSQIYRNLIMSKMIGALPVAFYWDLNRDTYRNNLENLKDSLINFINKNRFNYANKQGLCESAKISYWYNNPGVSFLRVPRSYSLMNNGDPDEFIYDFKITAAMSLLKWIVVTHESQVSKLISISGKVPLSFFHFALRECANYARRLKHEDIDKDIPCPDDNEWQTFLDYFYKAVHVGNHFKQSGLESEMSLVHKSRTMLKKLKDLYPYMDMDGFMNIWILKPSYGSRGLGIHFCRTLPYVLKVIKENKTNNYVIQKYIERPLLIYNTKFDIRQWFMISSTQPITIWIYRECYLRFSSQTYNLRKLHESIHLTNNSVQSKYHNGNRDLCLPSHNMWYLADFKDYLNNIGYPNVFEQIIYPGMKECIVAAILTNQDQISRTNKAFELHGADFMITEDFTPWLIEVNSKPALNPSTPVTAKLCPMVLEDVIKVVVDNARNPRAPTGHFEQIYKEKILPAPHEVQGLRLEGKPIAADYFLKPEDAANAIGCKPSRSSDSLNVITTADYMKYVGNEMKKTLRQLLSIIEKERNRRVIKNKSKTNSDETYNYCKDMQQIQSNMEEIEEIFKQDLDKAESTESVVANMAGGKRKQTSSGSSEPATLNVRKASDSTLKSSSKVISQALTTLNMRTDSKVVNNVMKMVSSMKFSDDPQNMPTVQAPPKPATTNRRNNAKKPTKFELMLERARGKGV